MKKSTLKNTTKNLALALAASLLLGELAPLRVGGVLTPIPATVSAAGTSASTATPTSGTTGRAAPANFRKYGITYKDYVAKNGEPTSGTLLVGTYLISIAPVTTTNPDGSTYTESGISGEAYQSALISKLTYQQDVYFYKSELNGGNWVDIDTASSLNYLKPDTSISVDENELNAMLITAVVNGDDVETMTNDDASDENPFLNPSPYNLDDITALSEIKTRLDEGQLKSWPELRTRVSYLFAHDEETDTIPLQDSDGETAKPLFDEIMNGKTTSKTTAVQEFMDDVEKTGVIDEDRIDEIVGDGSPTSKATPIVGAPLVANAAGSDNPFTGGMDGTIASAARVLYHFSDTRDELTSQMDAAVVNLWNWYLDYKYDNVSFLDNDISNSKKAAMLYEVCSMSDATRRARALYNLSISPDFHGGYGAPLLVIRSDKSYLGQYSELRAYWAGVYAANDWIDHSTILAGKSYYECLEISAQIRKEFVADNYAALDALNNAVTEARDLYTDYSARSFVRGATANAHLIYDDEMELTKKTTLNDETDALLGEIICASNVRDGKTVVPRGEAAVLKNKLIGAENDLFHEALTEDLAEEWGTKNYAKKSYSYRTVWEFFAGGQNVIKTIEREQERLITEYLKRENDATEYTPVLKEQLVWIVGEKSKIPYDVYWTRYPEEVRQTYEDFIRAKIKDLNIDISDLDLDPLDDEDDPILKALNEALKKAIKDGDPKLAEALKKLIQKYKDNPVPTPFGFTPVVDIDPSTGLPYVKFVPNDPYTPTDTDNDGDPGDTGNNNNTTANDPNNPNGNVNNRDPNDPNYGDPEDPNNPNFNGDPNDTTANDPNGNDTDPNGRDPNGSNYGENDRAGNGDYNGDDGTGTGNGANGNGRGSGTGTGSGSGGYGDGADGSGNGGTNGSGADGSGSRSG